MALMSYMVMLERVFARESKRSMVGDVEGGEVGVDMLSICDPQRRGRLVCYVLLLTVNGFQLFPAPRLALPLQCCLAYNSSN